MRPRWKTMGRILDDYYSIDMELYVWFDLEIGNMSVVLQAAHDAFGVELRWLAL